MIPNCIFSSGSSAKSLKKASLLRLATLFKERGVYIDTGAGIEQTAFFHDTYVSLNPLRWFQCEQQFAFLEAGARIPRRHTAFHAFKDRFCHTVNNALIGAKSRNVLLGNTSTIPDRNTSHAKTHPKRKFQ